MKTRTQALIATAFALGAVAAPAVHASADTAVFAAGYGPFEQRPATLALWVSDAFVHLRWTSWGASTATAHGGITEHEAGRYRTLPASVELSRIRPCGHRRVYTRVAYQSVDGRWVQGHRNGCRLAP